MSAATLVFGIETEYGFTAFNAQGRALDRAGHVTRLVFGARRRWPSVRGRDWSDVYLGNGARLYVDCSHPEYATPECTTPEEAVAAVRAGDRILEQLARDLEQNLRVSHAFVYRGNVDYGDSNVTWGCHESLLHRSHRSVVARNLVPHLVSRIIYAGAGGLDASSQGITFTIAPRARFTTRRSYVGGMGGQRALIHSKSESLGGPGMERLHVTCGESLCSEWADYLRIGTTALIVALIDAGLDPGMDVSFEDSIQAMHVFAADPTCTRDVGMADGSRMTAVQVQRHFLEMARRNLGSSFMPSWAPVLCERWATTLDGLDRDPLELASRLDWPLKLVLYRESAARAGLSRETIDTINRVLVPWLVSRPIETPRPAAADRFQLGLWPPDSAEAVQTVAELDHHGVTRETVDVFATLRSRLFEMETRFSEPGRGLFAELDRAGVLDHRILDAGAVERAVTHAPTTTRARQRSRYIRSLAHEPDATCEWTRIVAGKRFADMIDPFGGVRPRWKPFDLPERPVPEVGT